MGEQTKIQWTEATWNPIVGCSVVSPGCTNCYAMAMAARLQKINRTGGSGTNYVNHYDGTTQDSKAGPVWTGKVALAPDKILTAPLSRRKPTVYFVNSMGDLFHESVPDDWIDRVFAVMALCPQHTFQCLTKRSARMRKYLSSPLSSFRVGKLAYDRTKFSILWPPPNVWVGVSAEDQCRYDERKDDLRNTPGVIRFFSFEPLLGPIDADYTGDWAIIGGESGPKARAFHVDWARFLILRCKANGTACFVKQLGARPVEGYSTSARDLNLADRKGGNPAEWPEDLRVREMPGMAT